MRSLLFSLFLFILPVSSADQNDPKLGELFNELASSLPLEQGLDVTRQIWEIWHEAPDDQSGQILRNGIAFMQEGLMPSALAEFDRLVEVAPQFAEGWNKRATVLFYMDQYNASVADIEKTLLLEPRHFGALSGLGMIYMNSGKFKAALVAFQSAQEVNPYLPGVNQNIERVNELLKKERI